MISWIETNAIYDCYAVLYTNTTNWFWKRRKKKSSRLNWRYLHIKHYHNGVFQTEKPVSCPWKAGKNITSFVIQTQLINTRYNRTNAARLIKNVLSEISFFVFIVEPIAVSYRIHKCYHRKSRFESSLFIWYSGVDFFYHTDSNACFTFK